MKNCFRKIEIKKQNRKFKQNADLFLFFAKIKTAENMMNTKNIKTIEKNFDRNQRQRANRVAKYEKMHARCIFKNQISFTFLIFFSRKSSKFSFISNFMFAMFFLSILIFNEKSSTVSNDD